MSIKAPELLQAYHDLTAFNCGEPTLNSWLTKRALKSNRDGAARTYVVCVDSKVIGYFSLAAGNISRSIATGKVRRNMPDPVPIMLLARLAVDIHWQGHGLGYSMLQNAVRRTLQASSIAGIRAMLVHAISEEAKKFYQHLGFQPSVSEPMTLMATLGDLQNACS